MKIAKILLQIVVSILFLGCSGYFIYELYTLNVLPFKFLIMACLLIGLLDIIFILLVNFYGKKIWSKTIIILIALFYSVGSGAGGYYLMKTHSMMGDVTSVSMKTTSKASVIVMKDNEAKNIKGIENKKVGTLRLIGTVGTKACLEDIRSKDVPFEEVTYDGISLMVDALYAGEVDAIILTESSRSNVTELDEYKKFNKETKVIYQTAFEINGNNKAKAVTDITESSFNVLISGSDSRNGLDEIAGSDVNMIVTVNPKTNTVLMTSIPRDYYVTTVCDVEDACQNGAMDKLTHTGIHGINTTKQTVENLLGIEINYTLRVGFKSVTSVVDAIGGIDVYVEPGLEVEQFRNKDFGLGSGWQHLNGKVALAYSRERYSYVDGDVQRNKNQQQVLEAIIDKVISPEILTNYGSLMDAIVGTFETTVSVTEIQDMIQYQLNENPKWKFEKYALRGFDDMQFCADLGQAAYVMVPDQYTIDIAKQKITAVMNGQSSKTIKDELEAGPADGINPEMPQDQVQVDIPEDAIIQ